LHFFILKNYH